MAAAAPATAGADQLLQMCFGPGDRELNLSAVMSRVGDLRRSLDTVAADMAEGRGAHWAAFLDRLAVINVQHMQVVAQLRPLLRQYAAFPKFIDSAQVEGEVPSLLASRLLPEQEAEEGEARARLLGPSQQPELVLAAAEQQLEGLRAAGPQRKAVEGLHSQIQRAIAEQQAARARGAAAAGGAARGAPGAGQKRARGGSGGGGDAAAAAADDPLLRDLASGAAYRQQFNATAGGGGGGGAQKK
ncbi:hypothetical protein Rsub_02646 [Raphidocelis subcapitata]|uniref:Mediator of RNA polymerase II transcription subunit 8 n=1 Tax=Raphidocelis subcapitata TaxID=307507 RepID=A0A2V0NTE6_9CHLO|nr:hypothetical protein Rsub_02646 [Raphidocelis subcapitata]|eukprot:GBF89942.1 hypothetical protein Rsub_02646 [Raphidocelis subcapitata]